MKQIIMTPKAIGAGFNPKDAEHATTIGMSAIAIAKFTANCVINSAAK